MFRPTAAPAFLLLVVALAGCVQGPDAAAFRPVLYPLDPEGPEISRALEWLAARTRADGCIGARPEGPCTHATTRDAAIALSAVGVDVAAWRPAGASPLAYLLENGNELDEEEAFCEACKWAKAAVALGTSGASLGEGEGARVLEVLLSRFDGTQMGSLETVNDDIWGIFAFHVAGIAPADERPTAVRAHVRQLQNPDGGWGWGTVAPSDAWTTASAIMALLSSGPNDTDGWLGRATSFLESQEGDAGWVVQDGSPSPESTAVTLQALRALGRAPEDAAVRSMLGLQAPDGGFSRIAGASADFMTTTQMLPALRGVAFPFRPPVVALDAPAEGPVVGTPVGFRVRAVDPDGTVASYEWDFGDGSAAQGPSVDHVYRIAGVYRVQVRVEDDDGVGRTVAADVEVRPQ